MPRNKIATKAQTEDGRGIQVSFEGGEALAVSLDELSPEMQHQLALHGLSQKLGDSYSGEPSVTVALGKAKAVAERLRKGDWKAVREGGGGGRITDLAQALANVTGKTVEEAVMAIEALSKEQKSELRKHPQVNAEVKDIAAKRAREAVAGTDAVDLATMLP